MKNIKYSIIILILSLIFLNKPIYLYANEIIIEEENYNDVITYANQFVGNPYKWGGNSLTKGCDCSGFVVQIYKHFNIDLSKKRNSTALRTVGKKISINNIKKGDIICYPHHVALYAGNGKIIEAQSKRTGITNTRKLRKNKIITIRRVL